MNGTRQEIEARRKDGSVVYIEGSSSIIEIDGVPQGIVSIIRDMTERKMAEEKLIEANQKLQTALDELKNALGATKVQLVPHIVKNTDVQNEIKEPAPPANTKPSRKKNRK